MSKFKVGDEVVINTKGHLRYGTDKSNPRNKLGIVVSIEQYAFRLPYEVGWENGFFNNYEEDTLDFFYLSLENE